MRQHRRSLCWFQKQGTKKVSDLVAAEKYSIILLPGLYLETDDENRHQRSFPRSPANSQVVGNADLVMSLPNQDRLPGNPECLADSIFLQKWKALLKAAKDPISVETENMREAWLVGGEVHCASNAIRQPLILKGE